MIKAKKEIKKKTIKKTVKKIVRKKITEPKEKKEVIVTDSYYQAQGRRKTSVARLRLWTKGEGFLINGKPFKEYFKSSALQKVALSSLETMNCLDKFKISVLVRGGGISGQAEAIRHATARVLVLFNPEFRKRLKKAGFLRRDSRMRERKKFGLKRARRAPQWGKR